FIPRMSDIQLHIVSFDIPHPPNYGGVIDVYHKIRALHDEGLNIHLHCFYSNRKPSAELEKLCTRVSYYPRNTGIFSALSLHPYIVFSRRSAQLLQNLCTDQAPILFEGLHSCYYLGHRRLAGRKQIYRESNIEHQYYFHLFKAEKNPFKKLYFILSSVKLRFFERKLSQASLMLTVSREDNQYLASKFGENKVQYLPSFHADDELTCQSGSGKYILYQGNLSVPENSRAAEYLVTEVVNSCEFPFIIAGLNPPARLRRICKSHPHVRLIANPTADKMNQLIREAHINLMVTFQATGLKLKLLNALFNGRFCVVNEEMIVGTELRGICTIGRNPEEMKAQIRKLMEREFGEEIISKRRESLMKWHSNKENVKKLINLISD
ncbi:MAG: glycosyltransferase, partial [Bacteroidota bacterium]